MAAEDASLLQWAGSRPRPWDSHHFHAKRRVWLRRLPVRLVRIRCAALLGGWGRATGATNYLVSSTLAGLGWAGRPLGHGLPGSGPASPRCGQPLAPVRFVPLPFPSLGKAWEKEPHTAHLLDAFRPSTIWRPIRRHRQHPGRTRRPAPRLIGFHFLDPRHPEHFLHWRLLCLCGQRRAVREGDGLTGGKKVKVEPGWRPEQENKSILAIHRF